MKFLAEVKQVQALKLVSNDMQYKLVLHSPDPDILSLGVLTPETIVEVEIKPNNDNIKSSNDKENVANGGI